MDKIKIGKLNIFDITVLIIMIFCVIFAIINSVTMVLIALLFIKLSSIPVETKVEQVKNEVVAESTDIKKSQNELVKQEIAELKEALELEDLKSEYVKLYKELQNKKNNNNTK